MITILFIVLLLHIILLIVVTELNLAY